MLPLFGDKEFKNVGYPTPEDIPEEVACRRFSIPSSSAWLAVFMGMLTPASEPEAWQQFEGGITREEAAERFLQILNEAYDNATLGCTPTMAGGDAVIQQDDFGHWQMLDEGGNWVEPSGDYTIPPLNPRTEPTADERRCLAAANAASVLEQLYEGLADEYADNHDKALFFLAIGTLIATLFLPPLGLAAASFLRIATILVTEGFLAFSFLTADVWTSDFTDALVCILYEHATAEGDGTVTFDLNAVINDVTNELAFDFDVTLASQRLALQLGTILKYVGADGLNYAGSTTAITEADCSTCSDGWCQMDDFRTGLHGWDIVDVAGVPAGTQVNGVGIVGTDIPTNDIYAALIHYFGGQQLDFFRVYYSYSACSSPLLRLYNDADLVLNNSSCEGSDEIQVLDTGSMITDAIQIILNSGDGSGVQAVIQKVEYGQFTGSNPMPDPVDCEDE